MQISNTRLASILLLSVLILLATSTLMLQPTAATPSAVPDTHLAIRVMPDAGLHLTTWVNTPATNNLMNGSGSASLHIEESRATVNASLTLEEALFAEYPFNVTEGQLAVALSDDETTITLDLGTMAPPAHLLTELIPDADLSDLLTLAFNSTDVAVEVAYQSDTVQVAVDTTVTANLTALLSEALGAPFAISTPLILHLDYSDAAYTGNLTVAVVPGTPIDITLAFTGNASDLCIQGQLYIPYGTYPELGVIDASTLDAVERYLEDVFPAAGAVEGSLQNLSNGTLTCPTSVLDRAVIFDGEYVNFTLCLHAVSGDLVSSISNSFALTDVIGMDIPLDMVDTSENPLDAGTLTIEYYPDSTALTVRFSATLTDLELPVEDLLASLLTLLEVSPDSSDTLLPSLPILETASFALSYTAATQRVQLHLAATLTNADGIQGLMTTVATLLPASIAPIVTAPEAPLTNLDGVVTYNASALTASTTIQWDGDANHDVNRLKNALLTEFTHLSGTDQATVNTTDLTVTGATGQLHLDTTTLTGFLTGLQIQPPIDAPVPTTFRLTTFFDAAHSLAPDERIPQLSLIGGCNGTHTITLVPDVSTPSPYSTLQTPQSANVAMTWRNVTLHDLQNVTFHLIDGVHYTDLVVNPALISLTAPHVIDASAQLATKIIITELSDPLALTLSPATAPEPPLDPANAVTLLDTPIQLLPSMTPDTVTYTLQMMYTDQQLLDSGVDEATLAIQYWNATTETWTALPSVVDTAANVVETTLTHFSSFTLTGTQPALWTQPWFLVLLAGGGISAVGLGVGLARRRHTA
jgi:hypothetical protein